MDNKKRLALEIAVDQFSLTWAGSSIIERHEVTNEVIEYLRGQNLSKKDEKQMMTFYLKKREEYVEVSK